MDRLGMTVTAKLEIGGGGVSKVRIPFPYPVTERKAVKDVLVSFIFSNLMNFMPLMLLQVEMTKASKQ